MAQTLLRDATQTSSQHQRNSLHEVGNMQTQVRQRAYELYEERGRRDGHHMEDWIQAEKEVREKYGLGKAA